MCKSLPALPHPLRLHGGGLGNVRGLDAHVFLQNRAGKKIKTENKANSIHNYATPATKEIHTDNHCIKG